MHIVHLYLLIKNIFVLFFICILQKMLLKSLFYTFIPFVTKIVKNKYDFWTIWFSNFLKRIRRSECRKFLTIFYDKLNKTKVLWAIFVQYKECLKEILFIDKYLYNIYHIYTYRAIWSFTITLIISEKYKHSVYK